MELNILCLDDVQTDPALYLKRVLGEMVKEGNMPSFDPPGHDFPHFTIRGFGQDDLKVRMACNTSENIQGVLRELKGVLKADEYDLILVDDNWGPDGSYAGQESLIPALFEMTTSKPTRLPIIVIFTKGWEEEERISRINELMLENPEMGSRFDAQAKGDRQSLQMLIQRVVIQKTLGSQMGAIAEKAREYEQRAKVQNIIMDKLPEESEFYGLTGGSVAMRQLYEIIRKAGKSDIPVLILGESGAGKGLVARAIHDNSDRKERKFVYLNCASIPENLLESELFGYIKGAFTGAFKEKDGLIKEADGGTFFLDEIGDLPPLLQVKLNDVVQEGLVRPLGGKKAIKVDVRWISATNQDMEKKIKNGTFRKDLFYRLAMLTIRVLPLRERKGDIGPLADALIRKFTPEGRNIKITEEAKEMLKSYSWSENNVRELEGFIRRMITFNEDDVLTITGIDVERELKKEKLHETSGLNMTSLVFPSEIVKTEIDTLKMYIQGCLDFVKEHGNPRFIKDVDKYITKKYNKKEGAFRVYLHSHAADFGIVVDANRKALEPIVYLLSLCEAVNIQLIKRGIITQ